MSDVDPLTAAEIETIQICNQGGTGDPWFICEDEIGTSIKSGPQGCLAYVSVAGARGRTLQEAQANARKIVVAVNLQPRLLAQIAAQKVEIAVLKANCASAQIEALEWAANLRTERDISVYEKIHVRIAQLRAEVKP